MLSPSQKTTKKGNQVMMAPPTVHRLKTRASRRGTLQMHLLRLLHLLLLLLLPRLGLLKAL